MSDRTVELGEIQPGRSRHAGRRSAVTLAGDLIVVGTATGGVCAFDRETLTERWHAEKNDDGSVVAAETTEECVVVGERSERGGIRAYDLESGDRRWQYVTADDVGTPENETRFYLPFVADIQTDEDRVYVASRRYERDGDDRSFESVIYAFDAGEVTWRYEADASPISLDVLDDRVAVAYNRCPGSHQQGLVVLDADSGAPCWRWDPETAGQRRVGDVSAHPAGVAVASHGDYRGYWLDWDGTVSWRVDLATPREVGSETLYAYPNHVEASNSGVVFLTGNTYATESRETDGLHPNEHTAFGFSADGAERWRRETGGFAGGVESSGGQVAIPSAQHFRERDPALHGLSVVDMETGEGESRETEGVVTAVDCDTDSVVAIEEPVCYHDDGEIRGSYRLHTGGDLLAPRARR